VGRLVGGVLAAGCLALGVPSATAEEAAVPERLYLEDLTVVDRPVVEDTRFSRYGGQSSVVGLAQIEGLDAHDLSAALRRTPGVTISRYNPVGSFGGGNGGAVFVRGMGSSRPGAEIQTLIDDVPVYNTVWNHPLLDLDAVGPMAEIEVLKGAQPWRFGNAFSAINLEPGQVTEPGYTTGLSLAAGRYGTLTERVDHGGRVGALDYRVGQGYRASDGHRDDADGRIEDGYANLGYRLDDNWDVRVFVLHTDNYASDPGPEEDPAAKDGRYETGSTLGTLTLSHRYDVAEGSAKLYWNRGTGDWLDQADNEGDTLNDWDLYGMRLKEALHLWEGGEILIGNDLDWSAGQADFRPDGSAPYEFERETLWLESPYMAVSQQFGCRDQLSVTPSLGVRHYEHSDFDSAWTPHAGVVLAHRDTELYAAASRGVTYPGLNTAVFHESFWGRIPTNDPDGWRELPPERVNHLETGIRHAMTERLELTLSAFRDEGRDRYVIVFPPPPPPHFESIESYTVTGAEGTLSYQATASLSLFAAVTRLRTDPSDLPYAPAWSTSGGLSWRLHQRLALNLDAQYVGDMEVMSQDRTAGTANRRNVGSHILLNGKLTYALRTGATGPQIETYVAVENLTDTCYEYLPDYPMPGICPSVGMEVRF